MGSDFLTPLRESRTFIHEPAAPSEVRAVHIEVGTIGSNQHRLVVVRQRVEGCRPQEIGLTPEVVAHIAQLQSPTPKGSPND